MMAKDEGVVSGQSVSTRTLMRSDDHVNRRFIKKIFKFLYQRFQMWASSRRRVSPDVLSRRAQPGVILRG